MLSFVLLSFMKCVESTIPEYSGHAWLDISLLQIQLFVQNFIGLCQISGRRNALFSPIYLPNYLWFFIPIHLSTYMYVCHSIHRRIRLPVYPSIYLPFHSLSAKCHSKFTYPCTCHMFTCLIVNLSIYLDFSLYLFLLSFINVVYFYNL